MNRQAFSIQKDTRILLFLLICTFILAYTYLEGVKRDLRDFEIETETKHLLESQIFNTSDIRAKNIYIYNFTKHEEIFGQREDQQKYIASLTKIMTVFTAERTKTPSILISKKSILNWEPNKVEPGDVWNIDTLGKIMMVSSSNNVAEAFRNYFSSADDFDFVEEMNTNAKRLGLENTTFINATGLDEGNKGNMSTAKDITHLSFITYTYAPDIASSTVSPELRFTTPTKDTLEVKNTNIIAQDIPNLLFSKTGYTENAGGTLSILYKSPTTEDIIGITVLDSTRDARFSDMIKLIGKTELYLKTRYVQ